MEPDQVNTEEFLEWFDDDSAEAIMTRRCLATLSLDEFTEGPCKTDADFESRLVKYDMYEYAARHWTDHLQSLHEVPTAPIRSFLMNRNKVASASQVMSVSDERPPQPGYSQKFDPPGSGFHLAAQLGLTSVLACLLEVEQLPTEIDARGRTPLLCAIENGHQETIKLLSRFDRTTITLLLDNARIPMASTLIRAAGPDIRDWSFNTPLHISIIRKDLEMVRLSLQSGVDVHTKNIDGRSAIQLAVQLLQREAIDLLLDHSAEITQISAKDWLRAFGKCGAESETMIIELVEDHLERKKIDFLPMKDWKRTEHPPISYTKRRMLIYPEPTCWLSPGLEDFLKHPVNYMENREDYCFYVLQTSPIVSTKDYQMPHYSVLASVPSLVQPKYDEPVGYNLKTLRISWIMRVRPDLKGNGRWTSVDHGSTLQNGSESGSIPSSGMAFLSDLVSELTIDWLAFCDQVDAHLLLCRLDVLKASGERRGLIKCLLMDATTWINLRRRYNKQVGALRNFCKEYQNLAYEDSASDLVARTIDSFASIIKPRFDTFDKDSSALIELEFNLTSIREAQKSTTLSLSMKRLSWITFIFLPLTFVSGLFGMNVSILENNPPWWWYLIFMFGTLSLTMFVWIIFRKFPSLEDKVDDKLSWFKPRTADRNTGDVESGLLPQGKKKFN